MNQARRVAALYDIHGNLPALEAVLEEVVAWAPDAVVVGGDVVPGPMPEGCFAALEALSAPLFWLRGNGDSGVVATAASGPPPQIPAAFHDLMRWVAERMSPERIESVAAWPGTVTIDVEGFGDVLFCHATPRDEDEIFTVNTPDAALAAAFEGVSARLVVCGHTHMPFDRMVGSIRVVNAGSIGMPFGDRAAQWLALGPKGIDFRRTEYDLDDASRRIAATGYPLPPDLLDPPNAEQMLAAFDRAALEPPEPPR